jgi:DNA polymerase I-like protein with 3'-5' exonuclease and polymerase domains
MANLPALGKLVEAVRRRRSERRLHPWASTVAHRIRSEHSALNTLLQSAGAVLMKRALVILDTNLQEEGYVPGVNYEFVANVHDEWQIERHRAGRKDRRDGSRRDSAGGGVLQLPLPPHRGLLCRAQLG